MEVTSTSLDDRRRLYTSCLLRGGSDFVAIAVPSDIPANGAAHMVLSSPRLTAWSEKSA
ncbi:MAG: hypothetical protein OJF51_000507 [Nitrospira sp.]|nr:MAG: hypothetical protein OJF51_000507 [Nitrospira sp.]